MKKVISSLLTIILTFVCVFSLWTLPAYANVHTKSRMINIVFDDSGSMAKGVTSWSQAKYAMEVFAAMMSEEDTLNIYPMSSFSKDSGPSKNIISIKGTEDSAARVQKIEEMNGDNGLYRYTPIQSVTEAGDALKKDASSEKWLVVLTDGEFNLGYANTVLEPSETEEIIAGYAGLNGINVAYVAIGGNALNLDHVVAEGFFPFNADADNILDTVTQVAKTVYNYQSIPVEGYGNYSFTADIPIAKVIIFAQGNDVEVGKLAIDAKDIEKKPTSVAVQVDESTPYYPKNENYEILFADGLNGQIVSYESEDDKKPFPNGTYSFDSNVDNIEVYYEPGVDIQPILVNAYGEEIDISQADLTEIEAGKMTAHIRVVNPLTGEIINPSDSALLEGASLSIVIKDSKGESKKYTEGDEVNLAEGDIEVYAQAAFRGDIEKRSNLITLKVVPAMLRIIFSKESYDIDLVTLKTSEDIEFTVSASDGKEFTKEELATAKFEVSDNSEIQWTVEPTNTAGTYKIVPSSDIEETVHIDKESLTVKGSIMAGGIEKKGTASTTLLGIADTTLELLLTMEMPPENIGDPNSGKHYMFDPAKRGVEADSPYIKAKVMVKKPDGSTRLLTEDEWNAGVKGFSFSSHANNTSIPWKFVSFVCHQGLDFEVVKDTEASNYRLYLKGLTTTGVRPHESILDTTLKIKLSNGVKEEGGSEDMVSVRPLGFFSYVGRFFITLGLIASAVIFAIMELFKKRFDRKMCPNTRGVDFYDSEGPADPNLGPYYSERKIKNVIFPPWKPEKREICLKFGNYIGRGVTFECEAISHKKFKITNPSKFSSLKDVTFDGHTYDLKKVEYIVLNMNSKIEVFDVKKGDITGNIKMTFRKTKDKKKK